MENLQEKRNKNSWSDVVRLYKQRLPYLVEDYLGINMNYYISRQIPNNLLVFVAF